MSADTGRRFRLCLITGQEKQMYMPAILSPSFRTLLYAFLLTSAGCSSLSRAPSDQQTDTAVPVETKNPAQEEVIRPFPAPTLYSLMVAEIAGQRRQYDLALGNYLDQAHLTQDAGVARRATRIAQYTGADAQALEAAAVWVRNAPSDPAAHQAMAKELVKVGNFALAIKHLESVLTLSGNSRFDLLALSAQGLSADQKEILLEQLQEIVQRHPEHAPLYMAIGTLRYQLEQYNDALLSLDQALALQERYTAAAISRARVLQKLGRTSEALDWLDDLTEEYPEHKGIASTKTGC